MKRILLALFFILLAFTGYANGINEISAEDTSEVISLNKQAMTNRLIDPAQAIVISNRALVIAQKLNYNHGIAEAYRIRGLGEYYSNMLIASINSYLNALAYYKKCKDERGVGRVYNNIGNLYRDNDYDRSLEYFNMAMKIAEKIKDPSLIATVNLSYGNFYYRKNSFNKALGYYDKSLTGFLVLKDSTNIIQCLQNKGVIYFNMRQMNLAQQYLLQAVQAAKERDLNETVASIDLTLALVYVNTNKFAEAEKIIAEGKAYSQILKDDKLERDFNYTNFQLEYKRKNFEGAVKYLSQVYTKDSLEKKSQLSSQIMLFEEKKKREDQEKENELTEKENQYERVRFWGVTSVAGLLLVVVGLLVSNVKSKAKTNAQLTELNAEVSRQKDNLDRVNHHLEEIIDERTKDLQIKNRKLSDYSSYLSHQIRGPIATLKGLMNLEKEGLVDNQECINMMGKCVSEIDEKIIEMSDMMHDTKVNH
jgi:tetratricopeptide (TPR) repeat protein